MNFSFSIRKLGLAVAFYMINEIQPKIKFQNIVQCPFNGFQLFFDSLYILRTYQKYIPFGDSSFLILLSSRDKLGGRYYPMGVFTPVYPTVFSPRNLKGELGFSLTTV